MHCASYSTVLSLLKSHLLNCSSSDLSQAEMFCCLRNGLYGFRRKFSFRFDLMQSHKCTPDVKLSFRLSSQGPSTRAKSTHPSQKFLITHRFPAIKFSYLLFHDPGSLRFLSFFLKFTPVFLLKSLTLQTFTETSIVLESI